MTGGRDLSQMCVYCLSVCLFQMYVRLSSGVCHWLLLPYVERRNVTLSDVMRTKSSGGLVMT